MAILLTVIAVLAAAVLPGGGELNSSTQKDITIKRMVAIERALRGYRATTVNGTTGRMPCPADASLATTHNSFGLEVGTVQTFASGTLANLCVGANYTPDNAVAASANIAAGMVPVRTLGLPDEYALDGYGRRITYLVDKRATLGKTLINPNPIATTSGSATITLTHVAHGVSAGKAIIISGVTGNPGGITNPYINGQRTIVSTPTANTYTVTVGMVATSTDAAAGGSSVYSAPDTISCSYLVTAGSNAIKIHSAQGSFPPASATVALISHGANGHGAFPVNGSTVAGRINTGSTDADELDNASVNSSFASVVHTDFIKKTGTSTFDDIVRYGVNCQ